MAGDKIQVRDAKHWLGIERATYARIVCAPLGIAGNYDDSAHRYEYD